MVSCELNAQAWDERGRAVSGYSGAYAQGLAAYAGEQASIQRGIAAKYCALWNNVPTDGPGITLQNETTEIAIDLGLNVSEDEWDEDEDIEDD